MHLKLLMAMAIFLAPVMFSLAGVVQAVDEPTVTVTATDAAAAEIGGNTGTFTVTRTGDTTAGLTVNYTVSGTATSGSDYIALSGAILILPGDSSANITVTPIDDALIEGAETLILTLSADAAYTVEAPSSAIVTIADDEQPGTLPVATIAATDANAAEDGGDTGTFTVMRSGDTTGALTVHYTVGGTATAGGDYTALSGSVTILATMSSATILVTPLSDSLVEGAETVIATLSADAAYTVGSASTATVTIADNEEEEDGGGNHPGDTRPGWGCGDKNHEHTGPQGNVGEKESPCNRGHGHANTEATSSAAENGHGARGNHGKSGH